MKSRSRLRGPSTALGIYIPPILFASLISLVSAFGQVQMESVRTYGPIRDFVAVAMTSTQQGNVCVVGTKSDDFLTVSYSPTGTPLWEDRYGDSQFDSAAAIATDTEGNIWVMGISSTNRLDGNITMIKYRNDGSRLWVRRFGETINDSPYGLLGDASSRVKLSVNSAGNAYVVATAGPNGDYFIMKVSPGGEEVWSRRYQVLPGHFSYILGIGIDAAGNLVIAGNANAEDGHSKFVTVKYDPSGVLQWAAVDDWEGTSNFVTAMALDPAGNIYLTGSSWRGKHRFLTVKYSPTGETLWVASRLPANGRGAIAQALTVDTSGNVIVVGNEDWEWNEDEDIYELVTVKYDGAGNEVWSARSAVNNRRIALAVVVDASDNIYVGACDRCSGDRRMMLLKYTATGSQLWETFLTGSFLRDVEVDGTGAIYVHAELPWVIGSGFSVSKFVQPSSPPPLVARIEASQAHVISGSNITLSAVVSGSGPFTYRWKRFGFTLLDQTRATLTLTNVQSGGDYTVAVSNRVASSISPEARIVVIRPPSWRGQSSDQFAAVGQSATFETWVEGTEPLSYQWSFNGTRLPGEATESLSIPSVQPEQFGAYQLVVTNAGGSITSAVVRLVSVPPPVSVYNTAPVNISDHGPAAPYPSTLQVRGLTGRVEKLVVHLEQLHSVAPDDVAVLLVGPGGRSVSLLWVGDDDYPGPLGNLIFDDAAPTSYGDIQTPRTRFKFKPAAVSAGLSFPSPAPPGPYGDKLSVFQDQDPNGLWQLFVNSVFDEGRGQLAGGWGITFFGPTRTEAYFESVFRDEDEDEVVLRWVGAEGFKLQRTEGLASPIWVDVLEASGVSEYRFSAASGHAFFRLVRP